MNNEKIYLIIEEVLELIASRSGKERERLEKEWAGRLANIKLDRPTFNRLKQRFDRLNEHYTPIEQDRWAIEELHMKKQAKRERLDYEKEEERKKSLKLTEGTTVYGCFLEQGGRSPVGVIERDNLGVKGRLKELRKRATYPEEKTGFEWFFKDEKPLIGTDADKELEPDTETKRYIIGNSGGE